MYWQDLLGHGNPKYESSKKMSDKSYLPEDFGFNNQFYDKSFDNLFLV